ncbi:carboxymuconolactone decarboxylase family protein [Leucobacter sp. wl10]|uniref:carboxymuconolactone decarboxylase family protein n=1 Tax=Leucobacter sp. wl10 TaxID=2304677 RepID=UPI000E5BFA11|nr:carboxymuconolactone decarboxylase family protein [Leucobacter sp. wl10]RGE20342.1 carboxymuconolactone decarboxylase family protein [Leucobacter sp. wl10]
MIIVGPKPEDVTGHSAEMYRADLDRTGAVQPYTEAMAVNPEAHAAYEALVQAIISSIGLRVYELATLGAARAIGSPHCLRAHSQKILDARIMDEAQLDAALRDYRAAGLSESDVSVIEFAEQLSTAPGSMTDADSERLRDAGFTDRQIVDIALAAGVRNHFSRTLLALAVPIDI